MIIYRSIFEHKFYRNENAWKTWYKVIDITELVKAKRVYIMMTPTYKQFRIFQRHVDCKVTLIYIAVFTVDWFVGKSVGFDDANKSILSERQRK